MLAGPPPFQLGQKAARFTAGSRLCLLSDGWQLFPLPVPASALSGYVAKAPLSNGLGPSQPGTGCQARRSCLPGPPRARLGAFLLLIGLFGSR